jgi:release factor glutamine methyltransferase
VSTDKVIWTVVDIIRWGTEYFAGKGVDSPRLTIELILSDVLQCSRLQLYLMHDRPLTKAELGILRDACKRRGNREPLQYILGKTGFYGLDFEVSPSVLIPRPETETLIDAVLRHCQSIEEEMHIHDLGTGSGCIAISIAHHLRHKQNIHVHAYDISEEALDIAHKNAKAHDVNIHFAVKNILEFTEPIRGIIVSNPPYIGIEDFIALEPELTFEPRIALTDEYDGMRFYEAIELLIRSNQRDVKAFFLEIGFGHADAVTDLFASTSNKLQRLKDLSGIERVIWALVN